MCERGKSDRARTFLGGMIAFNKRNSTMDCRVRDFSATGARVQLTNTAIVPDQFDLTIARKERSFRASMVWRSGNEAGVAFLGEYNNENARAAGVGQAPATKRS
ncbi:MAG: PilZ domain-containing protein [Pseudolabrys sp.]